MGSVRYMSSTRRNLDAWEDADGMGERRGVRERVLAFQITALTN